MNGVNKIVSSGVIRKIKTLTANNQNFETGILEVDYEWVEDYKYIVHRVKWREEGVEYEVFFEQEIILTAADDTNDRYDRVVLNIDSDTIYKKDGTPEPQPSLPQLAANELSLFWVFVENNTTQPSITNAIIYNENLQEAGGEYDTTVSGNVVSNSTLNPFEGTYHIAFLNANNGDSIFLDHSTPIAAQDGFIIMKLLLVSTSNFRFNIQGWNGTNFYPLATAVTNGSYGLSGTSLAYQTLFIPLDNTQIFQGLRIVNTRNGATIYFDKIQIQYSLNTYQNPALTPIHKVYTNQAALLLDQANQVPEYIYEITDASDFTGIDSGKLWVRYTGTTLGTEADYSWEPRGGGASALPVDKTGTTIVFTEDAYYNKIAPLTTGNIVFDMTGAIAGTCVWAWFDSYQPNFSITNPISSEKYFYDAGTFDTSRINLVSIVWDGNSISIMIANRSKLSTPTFNVVAGDTENLINSFAVNSATSYKIYRNIVENTYADLAAMFADQGNQTSGLTQYVTAEDLYYEYNGTIVGNITDYTILINNEIGSATELVGYDGTSSSYTDTGLTNDTEYIYFVRAFADGYTDSNFGYNTGTPITSADFLTGLVAAYKTEADFSDYTGNHNPTTESAPSYVVGMVGNAADFNGTSDYVEIPDHDDFTFSDGVSSDVALTIAISIKLDDTNPRYIFGKQDGTTSEWALVVASNLLMFYLYDTTTGNYLRILRAASNYTDTLHRVVITYNGSGLASGLKWYHDGVDTGQAGTSAGTYSYMKNGAGTLRFGERYDLGINPFNGQIDQIQIYKSREWDASTVASDNDLVSAGTDTLA